jgi:integrase
VARKGDRIRVQENVYRSETRQHIIYRDHDGRQREIRFPPFTPIKEMRAEVIARLALSSASGIPKAARDSLDAAIDQWAALEQTLTSWKERRAELRAWARAVVNGSRLGAMRLRAITDQHARQVMSQWTREGVAPKTIRNRRWSLQHLYRVLYGKRCVTPVDDIPPPAKTKTIPVPVEPDLVLRVLAKLLEQERTGVLRDAKTRARFMVRAVTGKRPTEIMRTQPGDVQLERREWRVRDGKGGWSEGLYLNDEMLTAWRLFIEADAWGAFDTGSMARTLRTAGWPDGVRPYELRHSVGIALSDAGIDLDDIGGVLGHKPGSADDTRRSTSPSGRRGCSARAKPSMAGSRAGTCQRRCQQTVWLEVVVAGEKWRRRNAATPSRKRRIHGGNRANCWRKRLGVEPRKAALSY